MRKPGHSKSVHREVIKEGTMAANPDPEVKPTNRRIDKK